MAEIVRYAVLAETLLGRSIYIVVETTLLVETPATNVAPIARCIMGAPFPSICISYETKRVLITGELLSSIEVMRHV